MSTRHIYGPILSRRLKMSLGVDIITFKNCPFDCIYCQLGSSALQVTKRSHFVAPETIIAELHKKLALSPQPDFITLGGSGEPTLSLDLAELIKAIKDETDIPVAILTGGSLFHLPEVRAAVSQADVILPSLDAGTEQVFNLMNRPAPTITFKNVVDGLIALRQEYTGQIWLEIMMLEGISDTPQHLESLVQVVTKIAPDKVQLNTPIRPGTDKRVRPMNAAALNEICSKFNPVAEVIAVFADKSRHQTDAGLNCSTEDIIAILARRPSTIEDLCLALNTSQEQIQKIVDMLLAKGKIEQDTTIPGFICLPR
ncbi:MAG: radical SAM protein [Deltaproteobacteria bacterium]|nr:radical SAM protein [Deltaproteobacteria bacterium]